MNVFTLFDAVSLHRHRKLVDKGRVTNGRRRMPTQEKGYDLGFNGGPGGKAPGVPKTFSRTEA